MPHGVLEPCTAEGTVCCTEQQHNSGRCISWTQTPTKDTPARDSGENCWLLLEKPTPAIKQVSCFFLKGPHNYRREGSLFIERSIIANKKGRWFLKVVEPDMSGYICLIFPGGHDNLMRAAGVYPHAPFIPSINELACVFLDTSVFMAGCWMWLTQGHTVAGHSAIIMTPKRFPQVPARGFCLIIAL